MTRCDDLYAGLIRSILDHGDRVETRNSAARRLTGVVVDLRDTPLVCSRRTAWRTALREFEWFLSGSSDLGEAHPGVRPWWEPWTDSGGVVRSNYGQQLRHFGGSPGLGGFDQVEYLVAGVRDHPFGRRNLVTTWHAAEMADPSTPITNCHWTVTQAFVRPTGELDLLTYQRSADVVCGLPHNWIQTWAALLWLSSRSGRRPGSVKWVGGDVHVHEGNVGLAERVVDAASSVHSQPSLRYSPSGPDFRADDFSLSGPYEPVLDERATMYV